MKVYAIQHIETGDYMPCRMFRTTSNGWSWWEPSGPYPPHDANPRLFFTLRAAQNARIAWAMGPQRQSREYDENTFTLYAALNTFPAPITTPPAKRNRTDLKIIELELTGL